MEDLATSPTNRSWRSRLSPRTFTLETVAKIVAFLFIPFLALAIKSVVNQVWIYPGLAAKMVLANIALLWAASRIVYVTHDYTLDSSEKHAAYLRRMRTLSWSAIVCVLTYIFIEHIRSFTIRASKYNGSPTRTSAAWILATTAAPVTAEVMLLATAFGLRRLLPPPSVRSWGTGYDWVKLKFWRGSSFRLEEEMPVTHPIAHFLWLMVKYDRHSHPLVLARWVAEACMFHGRSG